MKAKAVLQSLAQKDPSAPIDVVDIIHEKDNNDIIAEYNGVRCTGIFNVFTCYYYVDDVYGKLPDQNKCPTCGDALPEPQQT